MKKIINIMMIITLITMSHVSFGQWCGAPDSSFCPGNRFTNGDFERVTGNPNGTTSDDIDLATGWRPIWQSGSLADLACGGTSHNSSSLVAPIPNTGNYAGMWITNGEMPGYREGMFNQLTSSIERNSGSYEFKFIYSSLLETRPNNTVEIGLWGVNFPGGTLPPSPSGVFSPLTKDLFGAGNTVLLGTVASPPSDDNTWKNASVTFNSNMIGFPSNITHILVSHNDNVIAGAKKYIGFDEFCLQEAECCANELEVWGGTDQSVYQSARGKLNSAFTLGIEDFLVQTPSSAKITEIKAVVTNVEYISKYGDCQACHTLPIYQGSIHTNGNIGNNPPLVPVPNAWFNQPEPEYSNLREATWTSQGTNLVAGDKVGFVYIMPAKSEIPCCADSMRICISIRYKDANCEDCVIVRNTCTTLPLRGPSGKKSSSTPIKLRQRIPILQK